MTEQEFFAAVKNMPLPQPVTYRLYHDSAGHLLFYSMQDEPGTWIEIDRELYTRSPHRVRVVDGRVHEIPWRQSLKLRPSQNGRSCHPEDVTIIYNHDTAQKWAVTAHEQN